MTMDRCAARPALLPRSTGAALALAAALLALPPDAAAGLYEGTCTLSDDDDANVFQEHIYFGVDSARIPPDQMEKVRFAAQQAKALYAGQICLFASASKSGAAEYNRKLAQRRGRAVAKALVRHGIVEEDIVIEARGEAWERMKLGLLNEESSAERQVEIYFAH